MQMQTQTAYQHLAGIWRSHIYSELSSQILPFPIKYHYNSISDLHILRTTTTANRPLFKHIMSANGVPEESGAEFLYHVKRTILDFHEDKSGATQITDVLGTFTDLAAAKAAARSALASEGYLKDDFEVYEEKDQTDSEEWKHGDGVLVYAKAPAGQEFDVRLDTKPNMMKLKGNASGEVEGVLHYGKIDLLTFSDKR
jgi:hypothetical protein